jgi:hypothetical protein
MTTTPTRSTAAIFEARCEQAADLLADGWNGRAVVHQLAKAYGVSSQSARAYVREGRKLLIESIGIENRAAMFAQVFAGLQMDRIEARNSGNSSAAVGASKAMAGMLKQLVDLDPMRDFENAFMQASASTLNNNRGRIPRVSVTAPAEDLALSEEELREWEARLDAQVPEEPPF